MESSSSYVELAAMERKPPKPFRRPMSYSDSFFFIPDSLHPLDLSGSSTSLEKSTESQEVKPQEANEVQAPAWILTGLSFLFHISLISLFESAFFYLFISKSEDKGITTTVDHLIGQITTTCPWQTNQTVIVSDILRLFIDPSAVESAATQANQERTAYNSRIFLQAWMYSVGIWGTTGLLFGLSAFKKYLTWRKLRSILLENLGLVGMLGVYEFIFFKTIIYQYDSVSVSEIEGNILRSLQQQCGLLTGL
jgi:hypothetical protein